MDQAQVLRCHINVRIDAGSSDHFRRVCLCVVVDGQAKARQGR